MPTHTLLPHFKRNAFVALPPLFKPSFNGCLLTLEHFDAEHARSHACVCEKGNHVAAVSFFESVFVINAINVAAVGTGCHMAPLVSVIEGTSTGTLLRFSNLSLEFRFWSCL